MNPTKSGNATKSILMLHSVSDIYGASRILLITATLLKNNHHRVHVVLSEEGPLSNELRAAGIKVTICRLGILRKKYFSPAGVMNRIGVLIKARNRLIQIVKNERIDIVYSNTAMVLVGGFVAKSCGIKHIWHIHEITKNLLLFNVIGRLLNRNTDLIIAVSNEVKKHWAKHIRSDKIITIYNGLDYDMYVNATSSIRQELNISDHQVVVGMVGRVNHWKGHQYFVKIASLLSRKNPHVKFIVVGDSYPGEEYLQDELQKTIKDLNLESTINYVGFRGDIPNVLKGLDIFVLPSILPDPLPTVVLEAMACGRPVIATEHGGALEMVDDPTTGILIPWDNEQAAVNRFEFLISDAPLRKRMGNAGQERVLNLFSKKQYENNILNTIQTI